MVVGKLWFVTRRIRDAEMKKKKEVFKQGTVVVFDPKNLNDKWWDNLSEEDRLKYYGPLGYGQEKLKLWVFLTEIISAPGHCVLIDMDDGHVEVMRHTENFREATEEEV